jgi:hypothetical protein
MVLSRNTSLICSFFYHSCAEIHNYIPNVFILFQHVPTYKPNRGQKYARQPEAPTKSTKFKRVAFIAINQGFPDSIA